MKKLTLLLSLFLVIAFPSPAFAEEDDGGFLDDLTDFVSNPIGAAIDATTGVGSVICDAAEAEGQNYWVENQLDPLDWSCDAVELADDAAEIVSDPAGAIGDAIQSQAAEAADEVVAGWISNITSFTTELFTNQLDNLAERDSLIVDDSWRDLSNQISSTLFFITIAMVTAGVLWQALRLIWNKNGAPIADLVKSIGIFLFVSLTGVFMIQLFSAASDEVSQVFASNITAPEEIKFELPTPGGKTAGGIIQLIWSLFVALGVTLQFLVIILKDIAVVIASGAIVLAASGQFFNFSKHWLDKILGTLIGLMIYKPLMVLILVVGVAMMQTGGTLGALAGGAAIFASVFGAGPLMKQFSQLNFGGGIGTGSSMGSGAIGDRSGAYTGPRGAQG